MSFTLVVIVLPIQLYLFSTAISMEFIPYDWEKIHGPGWSQRIILVPTFGNLLFDRWIHIAIGVILFLFFGLGKDAVAMYRGWLLSIRLAGLFPSRLGAPPGAQSIGSSTTLGSFSSRARALFSKKRSPDASW